MRTMIMISMLLATACGQSNIAVADREAEREQLILYAHEQVSAQLRPTQDLIFANDRISVREGSDFVCGEVNEFSDQAPVARSRYVMGGYVVIEGQQSREDFDRIWAAICG